MSSSQSTVDIAEMAGLVSAWERIQKRSAMIIFGEDGDRATATLHVYESHALTPNGDFIAIGVAEIELKEPVL